MEQPGHERPPGRRRVGGFLLLLAGVAAVAWLARTPATTTDPRAIPGDRTPLVATATPTPTATPEPAPSETSEPPTAPAPPQGRDVMVGLDDVLPVVEGRWAESPASAGGAAVQPGPLQVDMVWRDATGEVAVVAGVDVGAYDPVADRWHSLPSLPHDVDPRAARQVVAAGGGVYVAVEADPDQRADAGGVPSGWLLRDDGWVPAAVVAGAIRGTCCEGLVVVSGASPSAGGEVSESRLSLLDPASGSITELGPPPIPVHATVVVSVPEGFVLFGHHPLPAESDESPTPAVLRWSAAEGTWTALPDPPALVGGAAWVGEDLGEDKQSAGRVVAFGIVDGPPYLLAMTLDLDQGLWTDQVAVPLDERGAERTGARVMSVAWDGGETVWAYGGYPASIQLAYDLTRGTLAVATPSLARTIGGLVWRHDRLVLFGGWGTFGQATTVGVWRPAGPPTPP